MRSSGLLAGFLVAVTLASCAGPTELARQSEQQLQAGDLRKAYELARDAVQKDATNERARAAYQAAAARYYDDTRRRFGIVAEVDTLAAAHYAIDLAALHGEMIQYHAGVAQNPAFAETLVRVRQAAAGIYYRRGAGELAAERPKSAYRDFREAASFWAGFRDVDDRMRHAKELATARIALLPFNDQTGVPGLGRTIADLAVSKLAPKVEKEPFEFTRLIDPQAIAAKMSVRDLDEMSQEDAVRIGRRVGATQVVWGRIYGLRSSSTSDSYHETIYHRVVDRDTSGAKVVRYDPVPFDAVLRERLVRVSYTIRVIDVDGDSVLAEKSDEKELRARTFYTSHRAEGSCLDYTLLPPAEKRANPDRAKQVERRWKSEFGDWALPLMLDHVRTHRDRGGYRHDYRDEFRTSAHPIYLDDLPSDDDLAYIGLEDLWEPLRDVLEELDPR